MLVQLCLLVSVVGCQPVPAADVTHTAVVAGPVADVSDTAPAGKGTAVAEAAGDIVMSPTPGPRSSIAALSERPLADLSPEAAAYLQARPGSIGVAVIVPRQGVIYTANGSEAFPLASVTKIVIMSALLERAAGQGRALTADELELLEPMITVSDNDAATALWTELGGSEALTAYLDASGLTGIEVSDGLDWGVSHASPMAIASLLARLVQGELLDEPYRSQALDLLIRVDPAQRWGVGAAVESVSTPHRLVGIKDGWYPDDDGWWVNSVGFIETSDPVGTYTLAVLTQDQFSLEEGVTTIEGIAGLVDAALHGSAS